MKNTTLQALNYQATVHTQEYKVHPALQDGEYVGQWARNIYEMNLPYVSLKHAGNDEYVLRINPHKMIAICGMYDMQYFSVSEQLRRIGIIMETVRARDWVIKRMDICVDTTRAYEDTAKCTRFAQLLLSRLISAENRYYSVDPITLQQKTTRIENGQKWTTLEAEHYNRSLVDQPGWTFEVVNRLEFRSKGAQAGLRNDEHRIVQKWIDRLQTVDSPARMQAMETEVNRQLYDRMTAHLPEGERQSTAFLNANIAAQFEHIYTPEQMTALFELHGMSDSKRAVQNFWRSYGHLRAQLFSREQISGVIRQVIQALKRFLEVE